MAPGYDYDFDDLIRAYSELGVSRGKVIYVGSDLTRLMRYAKPGREDTLVAHLAAFRELLGPEGTIFVPASSINLCNTDIVFDPDSTPSWNVGIFSEYVRTRENAVRSFHPFWSLAGIGPHAQEVLGSVSRHAYAHGSVWQKFVDMDGLNISIGIPPRFMVSAILHIQTIMGVPYRYTKEFIHPVMRQGKLCREPFYMSVVYRDCDIARNGNEKIIEHFDKLGTLNSTNIGRGRAWSFSHAEFFRITTELFNSDIYCWLDQPPTTRPYQN